MQDTSKVVSADPGQVTADHGTGSSNSTISAPKVLTPEFPFLQHDIKTAKNVKVDSYSFKVFSVGERGTHISYNLLNEVVTGFIGKIVPCFGREFDSIVSIQTTGAMWAMPLALWCSKPLYIFTTEPNGNPNQKTLIQQRPYQQRVIYVPELTGVGRTLIIDDVLSGGGTVTQMKKEIDDAGGSVLGVLCVIDKLNKAKELSKQLKTHVMGLASGTD